MSLLTSRNASSDPATTLAPTTDDDIELGPRAIGDSSSSAEGTAQGPPELPRSATPTSAAPPHRSALARTANFLRGPRPPARLTIRHYPWWPTHRLEAAWLRWTDRVAWKDPAAVEAASMLPQSTSNRSGSLATDEKHGSASALTSSSSSSSSVPVAPRRPASSPDAWWNAIKADVRINRLHWLLLVLVYIAWILGFAFFVKSLWFQAEVTTPVPQDDTGLLTSSPPFYGCTDSYAAANAGCGLDGGDCSPFSYSYPSVFRCPAGCASVKLGGRRAVGAALPSYSSLVVGGGPAANLSASADGASLYRGDSWVCQAAVHAGLIDDRKGGCAALWLAGASSNYTSSSQNGISSISFQPPYPISYFFDRRSTSSHCEDDRTSGYAINVVLLALVGLVLRPKPIVFFFTLICAGFWHQNMLSEPRAFPPSVGGPAGDFLPTLFVSYAIWRLTVRYVWAAFRKLPLEFAVGTMGLFWVGVMLDIVFADVPLQRLVLSDIRDEPGALTSLIVIIIVVFVLALNQVRVIRKVGALPKYLTLAIVGGIIVGLLAAVPTTGLRLHHYIIALVLLPFCAFETRLSLLYTAFLIGMFVNGVGRWGFDGVIQDVAVIVGSGISGSQLPALTLSQTWTGVSPYSANASAVTNSSTAATSGATNGSFTPAPSGVITWSPIPANLSGTFNQFQLLVDDILRYQGSETSFNISTLAENYVSANVTYLGGGLDGLNATMAASPHYIRLAYALNGKPGDFTRAATVWWNGTAVAARPGAT